MKCGDVPGDMPRPLSVVPELEKATIVYEMTETPFWDFDVSYSFFSFQLFSFSSPYYVVDYSS